MLHFSVFVDKELYNVEFFKFFPIRLYCFFVEFPCELLPANIIQCRRVFGES